MSGDESAGGGTRSGRWGDHPSAHGAGSFEMDERVEVMMDLYRTLREEISQSIDFQNQIILGGAVVVGIVYGLQFSGVLPALSDGDPLVTQLIVASIPPIVIVSTSLWLTEQSRMMRAGDFLSFLESKINRELEGPYLTWELWLRTGNTPAVHQTHRRAQLLGYLGFFLVLGALGLWLYVREVVGTTLYGLVTLQGYDPFTPAFVYLAANVLMFSMLVRWSVGIVAHEVPDADDRPLGTRVVDTVLGRDPPVGPDPNSLADLEDDFREREPSYGIYREWEAAYEQRADTIARRTDPDERTRD